MLPCSVDVPMDRQPWMNYGLAVVILAASIAGFANSAFFCTFTGSSVSPLDQIKAAFHNQLIVPSFAEDHLPLPLLAVTSCLLSFSPFSLLGSMVFLWVFGNAVNYKFGSWGYLGLFVVAAWISGMMHYWIVGEPVMGPANAVNGLMGAFLIFFPRNSITVLISGRRISIACGWVIAFYVACDVIAVVYLPLGRMMLWGRIFGFLTGFVIAVVSLLLGWVRPTPDEESLLSVFRIRFDR